MHPRFRLSVEGDTPQVNTMNLGTSTEAIYKRDRAVIIFGIVGLSILAWAYMAYLSLVPNPIHMGHNAAKPGAHSWNPIEFILVFSMWIVMMVAMMVPSISSMVIMFSAINRKRHERRNPLVPAGVFVSGYVAAWAWYSLLATFGQWLLQRALLLSPPMAITDRYLGGALFIAAGIFQFTPLKYACLTRCRSPLGFLLHQWREGRSGAFFMGFLSGNYCVVCCWALMGLMFAVGVMSLPWMAAIAAFVLAEKVASGGRTISYVSGLLLIFWGAWMMINQ